jgi:hypothetical protein
MADNDLKTVNFDGFEYKIEDLTPRAIEGFNMLVKLQQLLIFLMICVLIKQHKN